MSRRRRGSPTTRSRTTENSTDKRRKEKDQQRKHTKHEQQQGTSRECTPTPLSPPPISLPLLFCFACCRVSAYLLYLCWVGVGGAHCALWAFTVRSLHCTNPVRQPDSHHSQHNKQREKRKKKKKKRHITRRYGGGNDTSVRVFLNECESIDLTSPHLLSLCVLPVVVSFVCLPSISIPSSAQCLLPPPPLHLPLQPTPPKSAHEQTYRNSYHWVRRQDRGGEIGSDRRVRVYDG